MFFRHLKNVLSREDNSKTKLRCLEDVLRQLGSPPVDYFSGRGAPCIQNLFYAGCFRLFLAQSRSLYIVSFLLQLAPSRFRLFLARCRSFQVLFCSLQVVLGCFLLVAGRFRPFLARCSSFQVISCSLQVVSDRFLFVIGCFRTFQVVLGRFRSFRVSVSTVFSQYFLVTSRKVMKTREAPDVWRLYKNMNCAFPLMILLNSLYFSTKQFFPQKSLVYQTV